MRRKILSLFAFAGFALAARAAEAREYEISWGMTAHQMESPSVDAISASDSFAMIDVGFAMRVGPPFPILGPLHVEAQLSFGSKLAEDFQQQIDSELKLFVGHVGVRSVRPIRGWLRGFARADVGFVEGDLTLRGSGSRSALSDVDRAMSLYGGAGLEATLFQAGQQWRNGDLALAFRVELGYLAARDMSFSADPAYPDDDLNRIETASAPLGSADVSGPSLRFNLVGRF